MLNPDLSYLLPPLEARSIKHSDDYIVTGTPPKYCRYIYNEVPFLKFEQDKIDEMKREIEQAKDISLPEDWRESDYLKVIQCCNYVKKEYIKVLKAHLQWRVDPLNQTIHNLNLPVLEKGIIYTHGRDRTQRPIIILNAHLIDPKKLTVDQMCQAVSYFLNNVIIKTMMIPYFIENWIMIIETNKMGVTSLPLSALGKIIGSMQTNFCGRLDKMFILNPSSGMSFAWSTVKGFIDPITRNKIGFLGSKEISKIQEKVAPEQLEVKYGGTRPNVTVFWPPPNLNPPKQIQQVQELPLENREVVPVIAAPINIDEQMAEEQQEKQEVVEQPQFDQEPVEMQQQQDQQGEQKGLLEQKYIQTDDPQQAEEVQKQDDGQEQEARRMDDAKQQETAQFLEEKEEQFQIQSKSEDQQFQSKDQNQVSPVHLAATPSSDGEPKDNPKFQPSPDQENPRENIEQQETAEISPPAPPKFCCTCIIF